ncbi:hypothetical protein JessAGP_003c [Caulobacter phage Jess A]|nr:hypothetical protein JessAGP_003c [Caulobacter phage Jess A]WCA46412.1 hypothetical protein [Caulobacter phage RapA]
MEDKVTGGYRPLAAGANITVLVAVNEGGRRIGETHHNAKLTDAQVDAIRDEYEAGLEGLGPRIGYRALARKYGSTKSTVRDIIACRQRAQYADRHKRITKK